MKRYLIKYLFIGGLTFLIYYFSLYIFFSFLGISYAISIFISYSFSLIFHFYSNKNLTFKSNNLLQYEIIKYLVVGLINYIVQFSTIYVIYRVLGFNFYLGAIVGTMLTIASGFLLLKNWVFTLK